MLFRRKWRYSAKQIAYLLQTTNKTGCAATSNFLDFSKLLKVADAPSVSIVQKCRRKIFSSSGTALLKGTAAAGAVAGWRSSNLHCSPKKQLHQLGATTTNHDIIAKLWLASLSAAPVSETVASEVPASAGRESTSSSVDARKHDAQPQYTICISSTLSQAISESALPLAKWTQAWSQHTLKATVFTPQNHLLAQNQQSSAAATASETATKKMKNYLDQPEAELFVKYC